MVRGSGGADALVAGRGEAAELAHVAEHGDAPAGHVRAAKVASEARMESGLAL